MSLFRRYCKYKSNVRRERNMLYPWCSSVRPLAISYHLFNSWTAWRVSNKRDTHVNHFETAYRACGSDNFRQGQLLIYWRISKNLAHMLITLSRRVKLDFKTAYHKVIAKGSNVIWQRYVWANIAMLMLTSVLACKHLT